MYIKADSTQLLCFHAYTFQFKSNLEAFGLRTKGVYLWLETNIFHIAKYF